MSPSESDLRAALRDGEGDDRPDVDALVARLRGRRAQRRARMLSAAAAVVVAAGAAVGGAVLWGGSDGGGQQAGRGVTGGASAGASGGASGGASVGASAGASGGASAGASGGASAGASGGASAGASGGASGGASEGASAAARAPVRCPALYPAQRVPTGSAASGPMFPRPVASVAICAYTQTRGVTGTTAALVLTGAKATALTDSIERASRSKLRVLCPAIAAAQHNQLAIIGVTASGVRLPTVTTDISIPNCNQPITNSSAVRWAWTPPASLAPLISALTTRSPRVLPSGASSGLNGTPVR